MCYFAMAPLRAAHDRKISDAIVAWKFLRAIPDGSLKSPSMGVAWSPLRPMGLTPRTKVERLNSIGVYCFKNRPGPSASTQGGNVLVKLLVWGTVLEFGAVSGYGRTLAGYRAQRAEIHEIVILTAMSRRTADETAAAICDRWRGHGVRVTRQLPDGTERVLLTGEEPMPAVAA